MISSFILIVFFFFFFCYLGSFSKNYSFSKFSSEKIIAGDAMKNFFLFSIIFLFAWLLWLKLLSHFIVTFR